MFRWQLEALPNAQKVVVDITEDVSLPVCVHMKTLELVWIDGEWRDNMLSFSQSGDFIMDCGSFCFSI